MQVKTILNRIQAQPGFVYSAMRLGEAADGRPQVEILLRRRAGRRPRCSRCGRPRPGYDTLPLRHWEFVPLWGLAVFFLYALQRVQCRTCGVRVEAVPWATGKHQLTTAYA